MKKVYIIGICGRASSGVAQMFKNFGWEVSGSDQGAYPPITTFLDNLHVKYFDHYDAQHITKNINLVIIAGNALHVDPDNPEVGKARELGTKIISYPEALKQFVVKQESIVVVGTYGKTTITALLVNVFTQAGLDPSYMIGEVPQNLEDSIKATKSKYSIIEGDEHPTLGYSKLPKFHYYNPKYLLLTATLWDHFNIYPTEESFVKVFADQIKKLRSDGFLLTSLEGQHNLKLTKLAHCPVYTYSASNTSANFYAVAKKVDSTRTGLATQSAVEGKSTLVSFVFKNNLGQEEFTVELPESLLGTHNLENAVAVSAMAMLQGIKPEYIQKALKNFKGLKRHLESIFENSQISIYKDQGQHPQKAKGAVEALKQAFPGRKLTVILDPHASVLHHKESLNWYKHALDQADQVIVGSLKIRKLSVGETKQDRVTGHKIRDAIKKTQPNVIYLPINEQIIKYLEKNITKGEILLFLTTGDFGGLIEETAKIFSTSLQKKAQL